MLSKETLVACAACGCLARAYETDCPACQEPLRAQDGSLFRTATAALMGLVVLGAPLAMHGGCTPRDDGGYSQYNDVGAASTYGPPFTSGGGGPEGSVHQCSWVLDGSLACRDCGAFCCGELAACDTPFHCPPFEACMDRECASTCACDAPASPLASGGVCVTVGVDAPCSPFTGEGCDAAAGEVCRAEGGTVTCAPASPHIVDVCSECSGSSGDCAQGTHCLEEANVPVCFAYCCDDADCGLAGKCDFAALGSSLSLGVCLSGGAAATTGAGGAGGAGGSGAGGNGG